MHVRKHDRLFILAPHLFIYRDGELFFYKQRTDKQPLGFVRLKGCEVRFASHRALEIANNAKQVCGIRYFSLNLLISLFSSPLLFSFPSNWSSMAAFFFYLMRLYFVLPLCLLCSSTFPMLLLSGIDLSSSSRRIVG